MKKLLPIILISSYFFSSMAYAYTRVNIDDLQVNIVNLGSDNCTLTKQRFHEGVLYQSQLPLTLPADGQKYYFTVSGEGNINVDLTYQCGEYKKATLHILQFYKSNHRHTSIDFNLLDAVDMFETHDSKVTESSYCHRECSYRSGHKYPGRLAVRLTQ